MQSRPEQVESRREFFRAAARYGLAAVVSAVVALAVRSRRSAAQHCLNQGICSSCGRLAACGLPQALSAKRARTRG